MSGLNEVIDDVQAQRQAVVDAEREHREALLRTYRLGLRDPEAVDRDELSQAIAELGFSPEQVRADRDAFQRAGRLEAVIAERGQRIEEFQAASNAVDECVGRHSRELADVRGRYSLARQKAEQAAKAATSLRRIQTAHPHLFAGDER